MRRQLAGGARVAGALDALELGGLGETIVVQSIPVMVVKPEDIAVGKPDRKDAETQR